MSLKSLSDFVRNLSRIQFCKYYFGECSYGLIELVSHPYFREHSSRYFDWLHEFFVFTMSKYRLLRNRLKILLLILRTLTGKKHPQIKLQRFPKV